MTTTGERRRASTSFATRACAKAVGPRAPVVLFVGISLLGSACGTRLHNSAFVKAAGGAQGVAGSASPDQVAGNGATVGGPEGGATPGAAGGRAAAAGAAGVATQAGGGSGARAASSGGGGGGGGGPANTASDQGVTATSIKVGNITAIGGAFGPEAFGVSLRGLRVYFQAINDRGGINGRKLILDTCDDREDGSQDLACTIKLNEQDKIFMFLANNSEVTARSAGYEYKNNIPDLGFPLNNGYDKYPNMYSLYGNQNP
ncbi:MAG TPA: ABC transporter substrate-binding protein, partial [Acidimicrobiales bacterium]|nr:ABC transporter substrate-binding protein [Acidimicrobiales bacterium]